MTSNVGSQMIQEYGTNSYEAMKKGVTEALRSVFKPEFLNRIDETIIFHNLRPDQIHKIVRIQLGHLNKRLADRNLTLEVSDEALNMLAEKGYDPIYGARPLKRAIQHYIENPLAMEILNGNILDDSLISAYVDGDKIRFAAARDE
jgi:ATP-dependent Clp protease ATP-binding subunit ClpB